MDNLVDQIIEAHGGAQRWAKVSTVRSQWDCDGPLWGLKGWDGRVKGVTIEADTRRQLCTLVNFTEPGVRAVLDADLDRLTVSGPDGQLLERRGQPRSAFADHGIETPWDRMHLAYFVNYAIWNYLNTPYHFARQDLRAREIEPWEENGDVWRRLEVEYPRGLATHNSPEVFYFDSKNLLRRHDYAPQVIANVPAAHYTYDHRNFDGFMVPTRRTVFPRDPKSNRCAPDPFITVKVNSFQVL